MKKFLQLVCGILLTATLTSKAQVSLNATGGVLTATYTNVNSAFGAINSGIHTGSINILINGNTLEGAVGYIPTALVASGQATANYTGITIKPTLTATISGAPAAGYGVLEIDGADNVTFDGSITTNTKDLTVENANANTILNTAAVRFIGRATGGLGATFNTVKNCIIKGSTEGNDGIGGSTVTSSYGIYFGSNTTISTGGTGDNYDNNTITNNNFNKCFIGLYIFGNANTADNNVISNNNFGSNTAGQTLTFGAINLSAVTTSTIQQNQIFNLKMFGSTSSNNYGIQVAGATSSSLSIVRNNITGIWQASTGGWGAYGINITAGTTFTVVNNTISDVQTTNYSSTSTTYNAFGIRFTGGTNMRVHYNSVNIIGTYTFTGFTSAASAPLCITSTVFTGSITNNIFSNTMSSTAATNTFVAAWMPSFTSYSAVVMNNNAYMVPAGSSYYVGRAGTGTNVYSTVAAFQPTTQVGNATNNNASVPFSNIGGAPFVSAANLNIPANTTTQIESGAVLIPALGTNIDYNAAVRPLAGVNPNLNPDIGAYEFDGITIVTCSGVPSSGTITGVSAVCYGAGTTLTLSGAASALGISYQWKSSTTAGGPYSNIGTGLTQVTGTLGVPMYYVVTTSCSASGSVASTSEQTITINALPTVSVSSTATSVCSPGGAPVTLNASGASTYTWSPIASLSSSTGVSTNATPTVATVYFVTGTSTLGCTNTATTSIFVNIGPSLLSISATPSTICSGASSSLQISAALTSSYSVNSIAYSAISTPSTGVTTLCNVGATLVALASGNLDDGGWSNLPMPFNFAFMGGVYNTFAVSTNGFIFLGAGNPTSFTGYSTVYPSAGIARPAIAAIHSDLDFRTAGTIETFTTGVSPNRKLVVNYLNGQFYSGTGSLTAQAIIYETTNIIEVHTFGSTGNNTAVEGIQNASGTTAYIAAGRNSINYTVTTSDAYQFAPVGSVSYSWSPSTFLSATNINNPTANAATATTNYSIAIIGSNGCVNTVTQTLNVNTTTISITSSSAICAGQTVALTANGASTYTWNTGANTVSISATPTANATYTASGTSSLGCVGSATQAVTVNPLPTVNAVSNTSLLCSGSSATLTANGANTYTWNTSANTAVIVINPTVTTTYTVNGTSVAGCNNVATLTQSVSICTGLNSVSAKINGLYVYPNPSNGEFTVELNNGINKTIQITDVAGRVVLTTTSLNDKVNVNINSLTNGIYFVKIVSNNVTEVIKVVKQ